MKFKIGQKVKYTGSEFPEYASKVYPIANFWGKEQVALRTSGRIKLGGTSKAWGLTFLAGIDEIEGVEE